MTKNKISQKINLSSMQVIKTLSVLMQGDYSMNELIELLNQKESDAIFNNSVISKYINTCRFCGFKIPKINNKYYLATIPFGLEFTLAEIDLIKSLQAYVVDEMSANCAKLIKSFVEKIARFSNKDIEIVEKSELDLSVELFERAINKQRKIKLLFKSRDVLECIPLSISKVGEKTYFNVYNKRVRNIEISRLSGVKVLEQSYVEPFCGDQVVVFKLKDALAKRYEPRENEAVEINSDGSITVTNKNENKELLFSRLLRYDEKCEIIQPKGYREDMKALIDDMLSNYGVN